MSTTASKTQSSKKISLLIKSTSIQKIKQLVQGDYHKIYNLVEEGFIRPKDLSQRVVCIEYKNHNHIKSIIRQLISDHPKEYIVPSFAGDSNSKYAIYVFNQYASKRVNRKLFKHKHLMNKFVGQNKQSFFVKQEDLNQLSYQYIKEQLEREYFIIKPINKSASAGAFKIESEEERYAVKPKLLLCDHVIEEYFSGHLHSIDFYMDTEGRLLILSAVREMPFIELLDENKHSLSFLEQYGDEIEKRFLYFLPIRYDVPYSKIHDEERKFLESLGKKLHAVGYQGYIHVEYKIDIKTKKIGFIERGARLGGERRDWIKKLHYFDVETLLYEINSGDISKRKPFKGSYVFKNTVPNLHYVGIYKNFLQKTHLGTLLSTHPRYTEVSLQQYLITYLAQQGIMANNMHILIKHNNNFLYPSVEGRATRCKILFEVDDLSFKKLKEKKILLIESLVFDS